ncbi:MAG: hypothetical protein LBS64_01425 [Spirochaetaceae bacterium]|nr:hypothetical protein [Spirochaetaceae bacterium]
MRKRCALIFSILFFLTGTLSAEKIDIVKQRLRLLLNDKSGIFSLYVIDENGKQYPLFDKQEHSGSTAFYVLIGSKMYKLRREAGTTVQAYQTQGGGALIYSIRNQAEIIVEFSFIETLPGLPADTFRVDVKVKNMSGNQQPFALKGVFDTVWGERNKNYFSTAAVQSIKSEYQIGAPETHQWIRMEEYNHSLRFLFYGPGISTPQTVTMANKDILNAPSWESGISVGRSFTSIFSISNPAIEMRWEPVILAHNATNTVTFYISLSNGDQPPAVVAFYPPSASLDARDVSRPPVDPLQPDSSTLTVNPPPAFQIPASGPEGLQNSPVPPPGAVVPVNPNIGMPPGVTGSIQPVVPLPMPLNPNMEKDIDYALSLIDQITRLSQGPNGVHGLNRDEITRLNVELDRVLKKLRWQE